MTEKNCVQELTQTGLSAIAICQLVSLPRTSFYRTYMGRKIKDVPVVDAIYAELELSPRVRFWKYFHRMRQKNIPLIINGCIEYIDSWD